MSNNLHCQIHSNYTCDLSVLWPLITLMCNTTFLLFSTLMMWKTYESACRAFVSQVITGYLPSLILQLFLKMVPPIMELLSSIQGYISHSDIEKSACNKVLWFTIWNVFFATVFSGSILNQVSIILNPKSIPEKLAIAVPAQVGKCFSCGKLPWIFCPNFLLGLQKFWWS